MKRLSLLHLGIGAVGKAVIEQVLAISDTVQTSYGVELVYCGIFDSRGGISNPHGLSRTQLQRYPLERQPLHAAEVLRTIPSPCVLLDTTGSDATVPLLLDMLKRKDFAILSNKKPLAGLQQDFDQIQHTGHHRLYAETTVGAGLPILSTLQTLQETGDTIEEIQGCFSGTLGFVFSELEKGSSFSQVVQEAKQQGFTEPDPRDDLSGTDVARKTLILSRLLGRKMELTDIVLPVLYPSAFQPLSIEEFLTSLSAEDPKYQEQYERAAAQGKTWRYVSTVTPQHCTVRLAEVDRTSDIGSLHGPDNLIAIKTKRYHDHPLVIKGPGAGTAVTAAGVVGDLLQIVKTL